MNDTFSGMGLHRSDIKTGAYDQPSCSRLRKQLLSELILLDAHLERMNTSQTGWDFSMAQTYKEMIHSRQALFRRLGG